MKKIKVKEGIFQYEFVEDRNNPKYVVNITVLIDNGQALIIDTAYSNHAREVKKDLENSGITPVKVILSHFHPDHTCGSKEFKGCDFIGSKLYKANFENCKEWCPGEEFIEPTILVGNNDSLSFGNHTIKFLCTLGHCKCSITIIIDNEIMHVGDLIMRTSNGKAMLPYICKDGSFKRHIESLETLLNLNCKIMIFSHGDYVTEAEIRDSIEDRLYYLRKVKNSNGSLSLKECLKNDISKYESLKLHELNMKQL